MITDVAMGGERARLSSPFISTVTYRVFEDQRKGAETQRRRDLCRLVRLLVVSLAGGFQERAIGRVRAEDAGWFDSLRLQNGMFFSWRLCALAPWRLCVEFVPSLATNTSPYLRCGVLSEGFLVSAPRGHG